MFGLGKDIKLFIKNKRVEKIHPLEPNKTFGIKI